MGPRAGRDEVVDAGPLDVLGAGGAAQSRYPGALAGVEKFDLGRGTLRCFEYLPVHLGQVPGELPHHGRSEVLRAVVTAQGGLVGFEGD